MPLLRGVLLATLTVGLALNVNQIPKDKISGVSMGSHQHPPYDYRPFEEFILGVGDATLNHSDVAVAVAGHDKMLEKQGDDSYRLKDSRLESRFFSHFDTVLYTDSVATELHVPKRRQGRLPARLCCGEANKTLGNNIIGAQYKREHVLSKFYAQFPRRKWYVLTEEDVWWSGHRLLALLSAVDRAVTKESQKRGVSRDTVPTFVSGGPDGSVDGPFFIFNRALLAQLAGAEGTAKTKGLGPCRHALVRCKKDAAFRDDNRKMCRLVERDAKFIKSGGREEALYNWGHLISFCTTYFRKHQDDMADDAILKFWSIDYVQRQWDALPNFMQNGNTWNDAESIHEGFLAHIGEIYKCCHKCNRRKIRTEDEARYVLQQAMRALVCWHHASANDVKFLDDVARRDEAAVGKAIATMLKWAEKDYGCNWRGMKNSQHRSLLEAAFSQLQVANQLPSSSTPSWPPS